MFNKTSSFEEIFEQMDKNLSNNLSEKNKTIEEVAKVAEYLHKAASILEENGFIQEAEELTTILEGIYDQKS